MSERRGWVVACGFLLLGAAAGAGAVREHWLSCRGSMLSGSVVHGFAYGADFSDACLRAMDDGFSFVWPDGKDPWRAESVLGIVFALLLALAWCVVVATSAWSGPTRLVASLPALFTAAAGLVSAFGGSVASLSSAYSGLLLLINVSAVVALIVVAVRERLERKSLWKVGLALLGSTAVGFLPMMGDYAFMTSFSDANWDTPPGTGYPTAAAVALLATALLVVTLVPQRGEAVQDKTQADARVGQRRRRVAHRAPREGR